MNHADRMRRLMSDLEQPLLVSSLMNIRYLTGFTGSNAYLYVSPREAIFVTDGRYGEIAEGLLERLPDTKLDVYRTGLYDRLAGIFGTTAVVELEAAHITWADHRALTQRFDGDFVPSSRVIERYRAAKEDEEITALRAAAAAGDGAFSELSRLAGRARTERDLGEMLVGAMADQGGRRAGWPPIVAVDANAARPHHGSGDGPANGNVLLVDYGCVVDGYHSDMTRTVFRCAPSDPEAERVFAAVREANAAGIAAVAPGVEAGNIDRAARDVLTSYGYEEHFLHSTGHGVGLEIHEAPSVRKESHEVLEVGSVITVEPGVYLPGRLGVRIEDMVLVTSDGREVLTRSHKEMVLA